MIDRSTRPPSRGKPGIIAEIADDYQRLLDRHRGIEQAEVITAIPLSDEDKLKLAGKLGAMVGKKIVILHQFIKKTDKTPSKELEIARRRLKEVKNA